NSLGWSACRRPNPHAQCSGRFYLHQQTHPSMPTAASLLSPQVLAQLERLELCAREVFRGRMKGERRSKRKGQSVEFADFRQYVPGDDLRFIDWNLFARMERLYLKLFLDRKSTRLNSR